MVKVLITRVFISSTRIAKQLKVTFNTNMLHRGVNKYCTKSRPVGGPGESGTTDRTV